MDYRRTVNLPVTDFSMKAGLAQKEPELIKQWQKIGIYEKQLEIRKGAADFILHDGPPYANGEIHVGTALNKILKDMINKYKFLRGFRTQYVPGWDCHGLPIEQKVVEKLGEKAPALPPHVLRSECRKYAAKFVKLQMESFVRLGIFGDWDNPYLTMSEEYEAAIIEAFGRLVEKNFIYRGMRPVHWCIKDSTSLAEAEIEYHDHKSPSVYVKFPVIGHNIKGLKGEKLSVLIWTTTPWTLPANTGLSFHPEEKYTAVKIEGEYLVMAEKLIDPVLHLRHLKAEDRINLSRKDIEGMKINHCWIARESKAVFGMHVAMDTGTGIVHTAPGHGMEDYIIGQESGLPILSPVDDRGIFTDEVPEFKGLNVFDANEKIIELLKSKKELYFRMDIEHSYPHCWRCKQPIIFRSKPQWFFRVSDDILQEKALESLLSVKWVPEWGEQRMRNMMTGRPDWCLSRQRYWGVPITAFYCEKCSEPLLNERTIGHIIDIVREEGIDVWFSKTPSELLPKGTKCPKCGSTEFRKEADILDVWFDSGVSHFAVLDKREGLHSPADVYIEGNDQYRGWFQHSLWPSIAIKDESPFKTIITHGWTLDEEGHPMHKSLGNVISPKQVYDKFGADVLRLWVVSEDYRDDMRIGENLIQKCADSYRKIRNTFRYLLGNLSDFDPGNILDYDKLFDIDKYALGLLYKLDRNVVNFNDCYEFYRSFREIYNFCAVDMSSFYLDILKDRLYIYPKKSVERLSAQTAMHHILKSLMTMLSVFLPFTMDEVFRSYFTGNENDSVHLQDWKDCDPVWNNTGILNKFSELLKVRDVVLKAVEIIRSGTGGEENIGSSLAAGVKIKPWNDHYRELLMEYKDSLRYLFIVSEAEITDNIDQPTAFSDDVSVRAFKAKGKKCARCWNYSEEVGSYADYPDLCERCRPIVSNIKEG